jgi:hypothetical protein
MSARTGVLASALALIGLLAFLSVSVLVREGLDARALVSLLILGVLGTGVLGALTNPPDE